MRAPPPQAYEPGLQTHLVLGQVQVEVLRSGVKSCLQLVLTQLNCSWLAANIDA